MRISNVRAGAALVALLTCLAMAFASDALADAVEVSNNNDAVNGTTTSIANLIATPGPDGISLREAIVASQNTAGPHVVTFAAALAGSTITLGAQLLIQLQDVEVIGLGADKLTVSGGAVTNILRIDNRVVTIRSITLADGNGVTLGQGGAIEQRSGGLVQIVDSVIRNSVSSKGGAVNSLAGVLAITRSALIDNQVQSNGPGGAVFTSGTSFDAVNSTFSGNSAAQGGALCLRGAAHVLSNNTITSNTTGQFEAALDTRNGTTQLFNNIVAGNLGGASGGPDVKVLAGGSVTVAVANLIGTDMGHGITNGVNQNLVGTNAAPLDPVIGPLASNDAATPTHALLAGSPALDSGDNATCLAVLNVDQRGVVRGFDADGTPNSPAVGDCDRGAFELRLPPAPARVGCGGN